MTPRTIPCVIIAAALLATACGDSDGRTVGYGGDDLRVLAGEGGLYAEVRP